MIIAASEKEMDARWLKSTSLFLLAFVCQKVTNNKWIVLEMNGGFLLEFSSTVKSLHTCKIKAALVFAVVQTLGFLLGNTECP